ncbi:hypothetical protein B0T24DRAFT_678033 [Lasiosphaeria ovina]|uniref:Uncharacterized protein n=1 Tax=Lasiosphaeria ovina TaxID=92902 RepID=A0AAE0NBC5_9PEZI|nr:hypothetical protein B0T24DRAFT_678033 [Lasiosphaeria ovina]
MAPSLSPCDIKLQTGHGRLRPARWTDMALFFAGNYAAHAATVVTLPGESTSSALLAAVLAFLFPVIGVIRGVKAICSMAVFGQNSLEAAARSEALYMVDKKRTEFKPKRTIHGKHPSTLPPGYAFRVVARNSRFVGEERMALQSRLWQGLKEALPTNNKTTEKGKSPEENADNSTTTSSSYNMVKILISLGQTVYTTITLYRTRGDQLSQFGYAAFGLTVTPYVLMSAINLLGNLARPPYQTIAVVMESSATRTHLKHWRHWIRYGAVFGCVALQLVIVGALSSFRTGSSPASSLKGGWVLAWLISGCFLTELVNSGGGGDISRRLQLRREAKRYRSAREGGSGNRPAAAIAVHVEHPGIAGAKFLLFLKALTHPLTEFAQDIDILLPSGTRGDDDSDDHESNDSGTYDGVWSAELTEVVDQVRSKRDKLWTVLEAVNGSLAETQDDRSSGRATSPWKNRMRAAVSKNYLHRIQTY